MSADVADALEEVRDEARLADPRGAEQSEEPAGAVGDGILVVAPESVTLALTADERRLEVACKRRGATEHFEEPKSLDRLGLSLQGKWLDRLEENGIANEQPRLGADEDLTGSCRLLEPGGDVDGVARDECLTLAADDDLARVDADARLEPVLGDRLAHLRCGADRTQRVVLVRDRDPEDRHDRVADELLDRAAVSLEDDAKVLEVAAHPRAQRLRIGRLPESGRADEVAEENGDDLALLARRLGCDKRRGADMQKRASAGFSTPQFAHAVTATSLRGWRCSELGLGRPDRSADTTFPFCSWKAIARCIAAAASSVRPARGEHLAEDLVHVTP